VRCPVPAIQLISDGLEKNLYVGTSVADKPSLLRIAVTEKRTRTEIDNLIKFLKLYQ